MPIVNGEIHLAIKHLWQAEEDMDTLLELNQTLENKLNGCREIVEAILDRTDDQEARIMLESLSTKMGWNDE